MGIRILSNFVAIPLLLLPVVLADYSDYVTIGRRFVLGFLEGGGDPLLYITTQSESPVWVNVSITNTNIRQSFAVPSQSYVPLSDGLANAVFEGPGPHASVVLVEAESPVSVYGVKKTGNQLGDGFTAIPVSRLGTEYYLASFSSGSSDPKDAEKSRLVVIATEDATTVRVHTPTSIMNIDLAKYEAHQIQEITDLTGTILTSNKPIAVLGGACATVPFGKGDCQHLVEQIPDVTSLGRQYLVAPPLDDSTTGFNYRIRVISTTPSTSVNIVGTSSQTVFFESEDYVDYEEFGGNATAITADKPVLVVQYTTSLASKGPSMTIIPAIQMFHGEINFIVPPSDNQNYVSITARCSDGPRLILSNETSVVTHHWDRQYSSDQMCVYQIWISKPGSYNVAVDKLPEARFFVLIGGRSDVSYTLPVAYQKEGDACSSNPCLYGATCFNRQSRYDFLCLCQPGWEGRNCHQATQPHVCEDVVCQNKGRCYALDEDDQSGDGYVCLCQYGWGGVDCTEDVVNECEDLLPVPCSGKGICIDGMGEYSCDCNPGYTGSYCEIGGFTNVNPRRDTGGVIVVAGVIVGCLCFIAVIINVAFITRERCSLRRRRRRHRNPTIEEFRNPSDSDRQREQQQNDDDDHQEPTSDETPISRSRQRNNEQRLVEESRERRRSSRRQSGGDETEGGSGRRGQRQDTEGQHGSERRRSRRRRDLEQKQEAEGSERRESKRHNSVTQAQNGGRDNPGFDIAGTI